MQVIARQGTQLPSHQTDVERRQNGFDRTWIEKSGGFPILNQHFI